MTWTTEVSCIRYATDGDDPVLSSEILWDSSVSVNTADLSRNQNSNTYSSVDGWLADHVFLSGVFCIPNK